MAVSKNEFWRPLVIMRNELSQFWESKKLNEKLDNFKLIINEAENRFVLHGIIKIILNSEYVTKKISLLKMGQKNWCKHMCNPNGFSGFIQTARKGNERGASQMLGKFCKGGRK